MNNFTMVSYGSNSGSEIGMLRKANVTSQATSEECQSTFPNGQLNDSYVECVAGLGYAYKVFVAVIIRSLLLYVVLLCNKIG